MSAMLAVMAREMRMRSLVLLAGLLTGATIVFTGFVLEGSERLGEIGESTLLIAYVFLASVASGLGVTMMGRDLAGPRSVFLLSRPVRTSSIYFGKLFSAVLLSLLSAMLFVMPGLAVGNIPELDGSTLLIAVLLAVALVPICAALEVLAKARTVDLLVWVTLSAGIVWLAWNAGHPFRLNYVNSVVYAYLSMAAGVIGLGTLVAHAVAFNLERYDPRRQARRFSVLYATMVVVVALLIAGSAWSLRHLPISSLHRFWVLDSSPDGSSIVVSGNLANTQLGATFAIDLTDGRMKRLPSGLRNAVVSEDQVFWNDASPAGQSLFVGDFADDLQPTHTEISFASGRIAASSPDGSRIAWVDGRTMRVVELDGTTVSTIESIPGAVSAFSVRPVFESSEILRMYEWNGSVWTIRRANLANGSIETLGTFDGGLALFLGSGRVLARGNRDDRPVSFHEIDPSTAHVKLRIPSPESVPVPLSDGGWAYRDANNALATISPSGRIRTIRIPASGTMRMGGEIRPGILMIRTAPEGMMSDFKRSTVYIVDLDAGRVLRTIQSATPAVRAPRHYPPAGSHAWRLLETEDGLQIIDSESLELRPAVR